MSEKLKPAGLVYIDKLPETQVNPIKRWAYPVGLYSTAIRALPHMHEPATRAKISWTMDRYWRERGSKNSIVTLKGVGGMFSVLQDSFPGLTLQGGVKLDKQQPSLLESTEATIKRMDFLYRYVNRLQDPCISVISGGSMSYGRFYNVREGMDPSDLDLIVVYNEGQEGNLDAKQIMPEELGFAPDESRLLQDRLGLFLELNKEGRADVLSHKADVPSEGFGVSMHLMPADTFEKMIVIDPHVDLRIGTDVVKRVKDYKPSSFKHQHVRLQNFHGEPQFFCVDEERVVNGVTDAEVITNIPAHAIVNGSFVPGLYHNLLSPRYEMEAFSARECVAAATLFWNLMRRLEKEYRKTDPSATALKSHIRYDIFNPELINDHENRNKI
jgi:hypothetical protein